MTRGELLLRAHALAAEVEARDRTLTETLQAASAAGASQHQIAAATGLSRPAVQRRLARASSWSNEAIEEEAAQDAAARSRILQLRAQTVEAQARAAQLAVEEKAAQIRAEQEHLAAVEEAIALTRSPSLEVV